MYKYSAGIVLYKKKDDKLYVLLGRDIKYANWSDFGGKVDHTDGNDSIKTAIREFYEETSGVLYNVYDLNVMFKQTVIKKCICKSFKKNEYYMYLVRYDEDSLHANIEHIFDNHIKFINTTDVCKKFKEKCEIRWFDLEEILQNKHMFRGVFYNSLTDNLHIFKQL